MKINTNNVSLKISAGNASQFLRDPIPQVAFSGRSNVGKSSLINTLLGRNSLARVSSAPGKTITVNFYDVDRKLFFVDLPGYGYAKRTAQDQLRWSNLVDGYFTKNPNIDLVKLVVQLVDSRIGYTNDDLDMIEYMNEADVPYIIVATKTDKLNKTEREKAVRALITNPVLRENTTIILCSSQTREGKDDVWNEIMKYIER
ncbi:MAG: YihA family ribosome biogenesis GTP-binding protein [Clostridia bacterium]|nr:YihA family ribosome biogenesis GTP-binding protein [Clostridia bacterium]MBQ8566329.1 YihA family ribosome biogenesis GTP-binding protein [Clostridia bacterium]